MERLRRAIEVGWDPEALTEQYSGTVAEKRAAESGLKAVDPAPQLTAGDMRAMVTQLGDVAKALDHTDRKDLAELYEPWAWRLLMTTDCRSRKCRLPRPAWG